MSKGLKRPNGSFYAVRLIRNGTVRCFGKTYQVEPTHRPPETAKHGKGWQSDPPYDGRLDGKLAYFTHYGSSSPRLADSVWLVQVPVGEDITWPGLNCIDGYFVWNRWREIND